MWARPNYFLLNLSFSVLMSLLFLPPPTMLTGSAKVQGWRLPFLKDISQHEACMSCTTQDVSVSFAQKPHFSWSPFHTTPEESASHGTIECISSSSTHFMKLRYIGKKSEAARFVSYSVQDFVRTQSVYLFP